MTKPKPAKEPWEIETRYDPVTNEPFKAKRRNHRFANDRTRMAWHRGRLKTKVAEVAKLNAMADNYVGRYLKLQEQVRKLGAVPVA